MNSWYNQKNSRGNKDEYKKRERKKDSKHFDVLNTLVSKGHKQLVNNNTQMERLKEKRGLTENTIKSAKLCYINGSLIKKLRTVIVQKNWWNRGSGSMNVTCVTDTGEHSRRKKNWRNMLKRITSIRGMRI